MDSRARIHHSCGYLRFRDTQSRGPASVGRQVIISRRDKRADKEEYSHIWDNDNGAYGEFFEGKCNTLRCNSVRFRLTFWRDRLRKRTYFSREIETVLIMQITSLSCYLSEIQYGFQSFIGAHLCPKCLPVTNEFTQINKQLFIFYLFRNMTNIFFSVSIFIYFDSLADIRDNRH